MGRICTKCGQDKSTAHYIGVNSPLFNGCLPICRQCLSKKIEESNGDWNVVDKILQWADVPFIPEKWKEIYDSEGSDALGVYISIFRQRQYSQLNWSQYQKVYEELDENDALTNVLPKLQAKQVNELRKKWGVHYNEEELEYLENLHIGLTQSQNIVGALNENQALMLCKITLVIEEKIRAGEDFSKELKSYDELAKLANLTPKTIKDSEEIESVGELFSYAELHGWEIDYTLPHNHDEIDFLEKNIKNWNRYLYTNETGVAEEIKQRVESLKTAAKLEGTNFDEKEFKEYQEKFTKEEEEFKVDI